MWDVLWKEYSKTNPVADHIQLRQLHSFKLGESSIMDGGMMLRELRRKVVSSDPGRKASLSEKALFSLLLAGLPKEAGNWGSDSV